MDRDRGRSIRVGRGDPMEKGIQTTVATALGAVLLLVGIVGFLTEPAILWFQINSVHNVVHLLAGAIGVWAGVWGGIVAARWFNRVFGIVYALVAVLGFLNVQAVWSLLNLNDADNWLHTVIGVGQLIVGFGMKD